MAPGQIDTALAEPRDAIVSTINPDGSAALSPVWFSREDGTVYFSMTMHRLKVRNLRCDPRMSSVVDEPGPPQPGVTVLGEVHSVGDGPGTVTERVARGYQPDGSAHGPIASTPGKRRGSFSAFPGPLLAGRRRPAPAHPEVPPGWQPRSQAARRAEVGWCRGRDSNPHAFRPQILSQLRLPFRHPGPLAIIRLRGASCQR